MGSKCSRTPMTNNMDITGNGNLAIMINGVNYNVSNIFKSSIDMVMQAYRSELILIQFTSFFLIIMSTLLFIRAFFLSSGKEIEFINEEHDKKLKIPMKKYDRHLKELDRALQEINHKLKSNNHTLMSFASPLGYIENMYNLVRWSPHLLSIVITKLMDHDYVDLCICVLTLNCGNPRHCNKSWQAITCALSGLNQYIQASPRLCMTAINAGIVPFLASVLSKESYLDDLDVNPPVMFVFQMASRILHTIAQIDELKYNLEKNNCCEILLNVVAHTNDGLLRSICILTAVRITRNGMHKILLTKNDVLLLFRLYYESSNSMNREACGLKEEHILKGFYTIGQLGCL